jgi:hypothetical protein
MVATVLITVGALALSLIAGALAGDCRTSAGTRLDALRR